MFFLFLFLIWDKVNNLKQRLPGKAAYFDIVQYQLKPTEAPPKSCLQDLQQM